MSLPSLAYHISFQIYVDCAVPSFEEESVIVIHLVRKWVAWWFTSPGTILENSLSICQSVTVTAEINNDYQESVFWKPNEAVKATDNILITFVKHYIINLTTASLQLQEWPHQCFVIPLGMV